MKTGEMAKWLNVSTTTIKNWAVEFSDFLGQDAKGGNYDTRRQFTELDTRIMAFIAVLRDQNRQYADIRVALQSHKDSEWADLPQLPERPPGLGPVEVIPKSEAETAIDLEKRRLLREIAIREEQIDKLEAELNTERTAHDDTRQQLTEAREKLGNALGKLETIEDVIERERSTHKDSIGLIQQERQRERKYLTYALIVVVVVAVLLVTVVVLLALQGGAV